MALCVAVRESGVVPLHCPFGRCLTPPHQPSLVLPLRELRLILLLCTFLVTSRTSLSSRLSSPLFSGVPRTVNFAKLFVVRLMRIAKNPGEVLVPALVMRRSGVQIPEAAPTQAPRLPDRWPNGVSMLINHTCSGHEQCFTAP